MLTSWHARTMIPEGCGDCDPWGGGSIANIIKYLIHKYPDRTFAFISGLTGYNMRRFHNSMNETCSDNHGLIGEEEQKQAYIKIRTQMTAPNTYWYFIDSHQSFWLQRSFTDVNVKNYDLPDMTLADWLTSAFAGTGPLQNPAH